MPRLAYIPVRFVSGRLGVLSHVGRGQSALDHSGTHANGGVHDTSLIVTFCGKDIICQSHNLYQIVSSPMGMQYKFGI